MPSGSAPDKRLVFVSHVHEDGPLAKALCSWIAEALPGAMEFFVSTDHDSLPLGSDWPHILKTSLTDASAAIVIVTPASVDRRWIYFEAGAAYVRGIPTIPVCADGIGVSNLAPPLAFLQAVELPGTDGEQRLLRAIATASELRVPTGVPRLSLPGTEGQAKRAKAAAARGTDAQPRRRPTKAPPRRASAKPSRPSTETPAAPARVAPTSDQPASPLLLKISSRADPNKVAGALAGAIREAGRCEMQTIGAAQLTRAIKAIAIARGYLAPAGIDIRFYPAFVDVTIDGTERTAMKLYVSHAS